MDEADSSIAYLRARNQSTDLTFTGADDIGAPRKPPRNYETSSDGNLQQAVAHKGRQAACRLPSEGSLFLENLLFSSVDGQLAISQKSLLPLEISLVEYLGSQHLLLDTSVRGPYYEPASNIENGTSHFIYGT